MTQDAIDSLLQTLSEALKIVIEGGDATQHVYIIHKWFEDNAPEYLQ